MSTVTARIGEEAAAKLEALAKATQRSKSYHIAEALNAYLEAQAWQIQSIQLGREQVRKGQLASDKEVRAAFSEWGLDIQEADEDHLDG
ncbi:MAG: ribbon-helix-helix protein, CopG family [Desulfovibrio sp.]|nr:MAG: ribbon-helix-helix protein, CopG family [Desulfovibrio sp.]